MSQAQLILIGNYLVLVWILILWMGKSRFQKGFISGYSEIGYDVPHYRSAYIWLMILPIIIWAGTRGNVEDTLNYRQSYLKVQTTFDYLVSVLYGNAKGKGYILFEWIVKFFARNNDVMFFLIFAAIMMILLAKVYKKYSIVFSFSIFLFVVSGDCYSWLFNGIRQFLAVCLVFVASKYLFEKKYFKYIVAVVIASTIHVTALVALFALFFVNAKPWKSKTVLFCAGIIVVIIFADNFLGFLDSLLKDTNYNNVINLFSRTRGTNVLRVLVYSIPVIIAFIYRKAIDNENSSVLNFSINMSLISSGLYILSMFTSGIFVGRLPIFFSLWNYILLPWEIQRLFRGKNRRIIQACMLVAYFVFNYYQMSVFMKYYW